MRPPSLDTWTTIFLLASCQGFFLAFVLFRQKAGHLLANKLLALMIAMFSFTMVEYVAYWSRYLWYLPHLIDISTPFIFLYGVLLWYYVKIMMSKSLSKYDLLHLIPFGIYWVSRFPTYFQSTYYKMQIVKSVFQSQNPDNSPNYDGLAILSWEFWMILLKIGHLVVYAFLIHKEFHSYQQELNVKSNRESLKLKLLNSIFKAYLGFVISFSTFYILVFTTDMNILYDYSISFSMSFFIYWIGYIGYVYPEVFAGFNNSKSISSKYEKPALKEAETPFYLSRLLDLMQKEKPYLKSNLKLGDLAIDLGMTPHQLSQLINQQLNQNFTDFINQYRIREAQKLVLEDTQDSKLIGIAIDVGFNNKTSFIAAFKKFTGMLPSEFRSQEKAKI
jgi:AraC-like DNA-binding protein